MQEIGQSVLYSSLSHLQTQKRFEERLVPRMKFYNNTNSSPFPQSCPGIEDKDTERNHLFVRQHYVSLNQKKKCRFSRILRVSMEYWHLIFIQGNPQASSDQSD
ncbi:hypothetical protein BaRGS_00027066 [Batillaria attramentaria]|uniref:Uncharacterized protein n=1 Tax=Batillaria attramentaria TaxID=370345 RepID=A0ABD0K490_9CAEN